jgi:hypothetical protein
LTKQNKNVLLRFENHHARGASGKPVAEIIPKEPAPGNAGEGSKVNRSVSRVKINPTWENFSSN